MRGESDADPAKEGVVPICCSRMDAWESSRTKSEEFLRTTSPCSMVLEEYLVRESTLPLT